MSESKVFQPIASLTTTWSCPPIRGQLTSVGEWRRTSRSVFFAKFVLKDSSGEIDGVIFRFSLGDFETKFVIGATATIEKAQVKEVASIYRHKSRCDYELAIPDGLRTIEIESVPTGAFAVEPSPRILIRDLMEKAEARRLVSVIGVVIDVEKTSSASSNGVNMITRNFRIIDESSMEVEVTIWHEGATRFTSPVGTVVAMRDIAVRVQGVTRIKSLTFQKNTRLEINPPIEATERLKNWYSQWKLESSSQECSTRVVNRECQNTPINEICASTSSAVVKSSLTSIKDVLERVSTNENIDTAGLVSELKKTDLVDTQFGSARSVRRMKITDEHLNEIWVDIWRNEPGNIDVPRNVVVVIRKARIKMYPGEKRLTCFYDRISVNPDIPETQILRSIVLRNQLVNEGEELCSLPRLDEIVTNPPVNSDGSKFSAPPRHILPNTFANISNTEETNTVVDRRKVDVSVESNFTKINVINERINEGTIIDVLGIVTRRDKLQSVKCWNGEKRKMMIELMDESLRTIWMAIWGNQAKNIDERENLIVAAKKVQVRCWLDTKELNCRDTGSILIVEPEMKEARDLRDWFELEVLNNSNESNVPDDSIEQIGNLRDGKMSSILGILTRKNEVKVLTKDNGLPQELCRTIEIIDKSRKTIVIILWGETARDFEIDEGTIILVTNVKIFIRDDVIKGWLCRDSCLKIEPLEYRENIESLKQWYAGYKLHGPDDLDDLENGPEDLPDERGCPG